MYQVGPRGPKRVVNKYELSCVDCTVDFLNVRRGPQNCEVAHIVMFSIHNMAVFITLSSLSEIPCLQYLPLSDLIFTEDNLWSWENSTVNTSLRL